MTTHNPSDRVQAVFQDARALQADALEMMALGKVRNAAEKAWGVTKRAPTPWSWPGGPARSRSGHRKPERDG